MTAGRLLRHAPTPAELERLYWELGRLGAPSVGRRSRWAYAPEGPEALVALAGEMLRYDARLLSVLLELFMRRWRSLDPLALRDQMHRMRWPQALCVVLEFVREASPDDELRYFADYVTRGWPRIDPTERFFVEGDDPAGRMAARKLGRNLGPYARWGFVGTERPSVDARTKRTVGRYDAATRRRILRELADRGPDVRLADYLDAVDRSVTRQQALADLRSSGLVLVGHGRGAKWSRPRPKHERARGTKEPARTLRRVPIRARA